MSTCHLPPPRPAPDVLDDACVNLLVEPLSRARELPGDRSGILRERVLERVNRSARDSRAFVTVRRHDAPGECLAPGVVVRTLYEATSRTLRLGEPRRSIIVELAPGACWTVPPGTPGDRREWLVMAGEITLDALPMSLCDYQLAPADGAANTIVSAQGAQVFVREAPLPQRADDGAHTVRDAGARWDDFAPGIKRRVLWTREGQASMLYHTLPGAQVPRHGHGHDEECLMLDGEVFLDDVLLRRGEYQLAPAGTVHSGVSTDTGLLLYTHGDLDLDIRAD